MRYKIVWLAIMVAVLAASAWAEPVSQLHPAGYVNDFAGVLDLNTKAQIQDIAGQIDENAHAQIAVVTVHTLGGDLRKGRIVHVAGEYLLGSGSCGQ